MCIFLTKYIHCITLLLLNALVLFSALLLLCIIHTSCLPPRHCNNQSLLLIVSLKGEGGGMKYSSSLPSRSYPLIPTSSWSSSLSLKTWHRTITNNWRPSVPIPWIPFVEFVSLFFVYLYVIFHIRIWYPNMVYLRQYRPRLPSLPYYIGGQWIQKSTTTINTERLSPPIRTFVFIIITYI